MAPGLPTQPEGCEPGDQFAVIFTCDGGDGVLSLQSIDEFDTAAPFANKPTDPHSPPKSPCSCEAKLAAAFLAGYRIGREAK